MFTVFLTHSRQDRPVARELAGFIECGMSDGVNVDPGEIGEGENLFDKTGEGLSAQAIVVLLSPDSAPRQWNRDEWMHALVDEPREAGVPVAFLLCRECKIPELLRRGRFFSVGSTPLEAFRGIKQWLLELQAARPDSLPGLPRRVRREASEPELETLRRAISDQPGLALLEGTAGAGKTALALEFAHRHQFDFDWVFWLNCAGREPAGLVCDLASQFGLPLERDLDTSVEELCRFSAARRFLIVLDHADEAAARLVPGGKTSILATTRNGESWSQRAAAILTLGANPAAPPADAAECRLLEGMCACAPSGFALALAAEAAEMDESQAAELAADMTARGILPNIDPERGRYTVDPRIREATVPPDMARRWHAIAVRRRIAAHARSGGYEDFANARHALKWVFRDAAEEDEWKMGFDIAWRAALLARAGRMPEAFEFLQSLFAKAEQKGDRQWLRSCTKELIWILSGWGRTQEAERLEGFLRESCEDQLLLPF